MLGIGFMMRLCLRLFCPFQCFLYLFLIFMMYKSQLGFGLLSVGIVSYLAVYLVYLWEKVSSDPPTVLC